MAKKLSKKLLYKLAIPFAVAGTIVAPVAAVVSCDDGATGSSSNVSTKWAFGSHRIIQNVETSDSGISYLEETGVYAFQTPLANSYSYNGTVSSLRAAMSLALFRIVSPQFDQYTLTDGKITGITPNRKTAIRFEMAESLEVNFFDGTSETFTSDSDDAKDDKSINGENFKTTLLRGNVKSYKFNLRPDIVNHNWIQQISGKKGDKITSKDLWRTLFLREFDYGTNRSESTGIPLGVGKSDETKILTIKKIDDRINSKMRKGYSNALNTGTVNDGYGTFHSTVSGFDNKLILDSLSDENKMKQIIPDDTTFIIPFDANNKKNGDDTLAYWNTAFAKQTEFCASPDATISEATNPQSAKAKELHNLIVADVQNADPAAAYKFTEKDWEDFTKTNLFKSGYLQWKISPREQQFVAGKYYVSESTTKLWVAKRNEDYVDERWLNQVNKNNQQTTILEYRVKTIQKSQVSNMQIANEYLAGTNVYSSFENLSPTQQASALQDIKGWGLNFTKGYTGAKMLGDYSSAAMYPFLTGNGKVFYNNNFSKAMYGDTSADYLDPNYNTPEKLISYQVSDLGAQFRTNLYALINKNAFWKTAKRAGTIGWDTPFAPEGYIGQDANGKSVILSNVIADPNSAAQNGVDEEKIVGFNVIKIENGQPKIYSIPSNTYLKQNISTDIDSYGPSKEPLDTLPDNPKTPGKKYTPSDFVIENIKEVLDKQVGTIPVGTTWQNVPEDKKVTFEFPYARGLTSEQYNEAYKTLQEYLRSVDPRLNMVAAVTPANESDKNSDATTLVYGDGITGSTKWVDFSNDPNTTVGEPYDFVKRLHAGGEGYTFASLNSSMLYQVDSPASVLVQRLGYQQTGVLLSLSYLADNESTLLNTNSAFAPLKAITDFLKKQFEAQKTRFNDANYGDAFKSKDKQTFIDALRSNKFKFENLYKSNIKNVAVYDYTGWGGFEEVIKLEDSIKGKATLTDEEKKLSDDIKLVKEEASKFFENASLVFDREVIAKNQTDVAGTQKTLDLMQAFASLFYQQFNPFNINLGDRRIISISFQKTWYSSMSIDNNGAMDFSRDRVDLDTVEPGNYLTDKVIVGGTVY